MDNNLKKGYQFYEFTNIFITQKIMQTQSRISRMHPEVQKIIQINQPTVQKNVKERIKQKLLQDAQYLLQKKKRQQQKRQKIRRVEEDLQRQRQKKLRMLVEKKNKSQRVMEMNKDVHSKKVKQQQDYFHQIVNKNQRKDQEQIQNALIRHKELEIQLSKSNIRSSKHERTLTTLDATFSNSRYNDNQIYFQKLSEEIENKSRKALSRHQKQTKQIIDRMKQKSEQIESVQKKALNLSLNQKINGIDKWNKKVENFEAFTENQRQQRQKKLLQRRQSFKYKLDKCNENLKQISYRQQQKYEQLRQKLEQKHASEKQWRDTRLQKYMRLWEDNNRQIEQQKRENASRILQKHQQITEQHRVYKARKDRLIQVVKKI